MIAAIHAGWKGAFKGIIKRTLNFMIKKGCDPKNVTAVIGPCISVKNYEVKKDFIKKLIKKDGKNKKFFKKIQNKDFFDLKKYVLSQLKALNIKKIDIINKNTFNPKNNFFSARRSISRNENDYGRNISVIMINWQYLMKLLTGNSNKPLSKNIAKYLKSKLVNSSIKKFSDGEIYIEINENIRGNSIFIIQSISSPANDNLMELLLCIDALKRSSAKNITAVIPYFGYARQDRKVVPRTSISAKLVSNLITKAGADRVVTVDLHAGQIQGFFDIPVDNLFATPIFARHAKKNIKSKNIICVAPDVGGTERARALGKILNVELAIVDKRRPKPGQSKVMNVIGNVKGKTCIIVDDIIDSGGTIVNAAKALKDRGAKEVYVYITHGVLSGEAVDKIKKSVIRKLVITDTIDNHDKIKNVKNIEVLPISALMGEAIKRISNSTSVSDLFK